jgi:hypothetical protein
MKNGLDESFGSAVVEESIGLLSEDFRLCEVTRGREFQQFAIGRLAPEKVTQANGEFPRG